MQTKKILLVIDSLGSGGAQNQITLLAVGLKKRGFEVTVFYYYPHDFFKKRLLDNGIRIIEVLKKNRLGLNVIFSLRKELIYSNYFAILSYMDVPSFYAAIARKLSGLKPHLLISHRSKTNFSSLKGLRLSIKEWVNNQADHIICNSHHERKTWSQKYPNLFSKISTIYNILDTDHFVEKKDKVRNSNTTFRLLSIGTVSNLKNVIVVIDAVKMLKEKGIDFKYTWLGRKFFKNEQSMEYFNTVNAKIIEYGLQDYWEWKEPDKDIDVLSYYQNADIFILASLVEGLPNVLCEALSCGLPCIASDILEHPRLINDNKNGLVFDPYDSDSLYKAILKMLPERKVFYERYGANARDFALEHFGTQHILNQYINTIEGLSSVLVKA